ncbi:MAG: cytochrome c nitrite reductase small subunit [Acidobacteria bacterium]|nr:MAG: cytochrome c nitrite reductase small subunit [Acidobacteriota bacterium]
MAANRALLLAAVLVGVVVGIGSYTFLYAKGYSYLTNDPRACANCHVMQDHFDAWTRASHRTVAVCNDCHTPSALVPKYLTKAQNGFWHSFYFTTGRYPDPLRMTPRNQRVTELACRTCHAEMTASIDPAHGDAGRLGLQCSSCHNEVGHIE